MADEQEDDIFIYTGGDQEVPQNVRRVRIDKSVKIVPRQAFNCRQQLIDVEFHDGIEIVEKWAFYGCISLRSVKLLGVKIIENNAFSSCGGLSEVAFGDTLETIGTSAFLNCTSLRTITSPSVKTVGRWAFKSCERLTDLEFGEGLETIQEGAFHSCLSLRRIAMPLNYIIIGRDANYVFHDCPNLITVSLIGGIHNTIASLHLEGVRGLNYPNVSLLYASDK